MLEDSGDNSGFSFGLFQLGRNAGYQDAESDQLIRDYYDRRRGVDQNSLINEINGLVQEINKLRQHIAQQDRFANKVMAEQKEMVAEIADLKDRLHWTQLSQKMSDDQSEKYYCQLFACLNFIEEHGLDVYDVPIDLEIGIQNYFPKK